MSTQPTKILLGLSLCLLLTTICQAQGDIGALVTDRPDITESASTIRPGFLQIETGFSYESFEENNLKNENYTYNTSLLRLGLLSNLELRIGWDFIEERTEFNGNRIDDNSSGFNPLLFGAKIAIAKEQGWRPQVALIGHLELPFLASSDYKPEHTGANFVFAFAHTLSERSSLSYNIGAQWSNDSAEAVYVYSIAYGYSLTDNLGWYGELYGNLPEDSKAGHLWDTGFTYLISNNVQLDATVGTSITEGQDILLSLGASFRIPVIKKKK